MFLFACGGAGMAPIQKKALFSARKLVLKKTTLRVNKPSSSDPCFKKLTIFKLMHYVIMSLCFNKA